VGYHEMTEEEQKDAAVVMWREVMTQLGEDAARLMTERVAQDENTDDGHEL
jgi:hypothetical protein